MMYPRNPLYLPGKLHAGRIRSGSGFQVFGGAKFCKHLALNAALFAAGRNPTRLVAAPVRVSLQPDILLLPAAQFLRQLTHHAAAHGRLLIRQQRRQPVIL